jgi:purine-binding chemotaxis protein CheW
MAYKIKCATFFLNGVYFGLPAISVQEVLERLEIVAVPLAPLALPGIINLRGQILPVLDLREQLQLPVRDAAADEVARMMVVRTAEGLITLVIDRVGEILDVEEASFETTPDTLKSIVRSVTTQICKLDNQLLLLLDIEKLIQLSDDKATKDEPAEMPA